MIHRYIKYLSILWICLLTNFSFGQKVGIVLSGGGATGMAHIGVLMALEENGIPIDYITGTSAGALIGGLYASGYSPKQIYHMVNSSDFLSTATGKIDTKFIYFFNQRELSSSIVDFKFDRKLNLASSLLPLNYTDPSVIDFFMIETFSIPSNYANYNFDSLFIPFRCVASDIDNNKEVIFSKGNLSQAIRASMTFPFYIPPLKVDGKILVDGGLYNNFPADVMCKDFTPDVVIGSSVTQTRESPNQYDILSQLRSMIQTKSNFKIDCTKSIIIEPKVSEIGTFDFESVSAAILRGYEETIENMDSIKSMISRRLDSNKLSKRRTDFFERAMQKIVISKIEINGVSKKEKKYLSKILIGKKDTISLQNLKKKYFRLITNDKIKFIFPTLKKNYNDDYYTLEISVKNEPEFDFKVGGFFSSRPNNTGFLGFEYQNIYTRVATKLSSQFYFGKFYNSIDLSARFDFPLEFPFYIEPFGTFNQWDYFRSRSTFFEDNKPAYLIKNEAFFGANLGLPFKNSGKINFQYKNGFIENEYYQTDQFLSTDTADITQLYFNHLNLSFEKNSLDNYYYSKKGTKLKLKIGYVNGIEINKPGSTSLLNTDSINRVKHEWFQFFVNYEHYFECSKNYSLGLDIALVHSSQGFFNNYSASILQSPQFSPIPETKTLFIPEYSSHTYTSLGMKNVINLYKSIDLRVEGYAFLPFNSIVNDNQKAKFTENISQTKAYLIGSAILVYNSPIGPFSVTANYFDAREIKWSFLLNYNFVIFNRKAINVE